MSASVDANVLIYAANAQDPLHVPARSLIERLSAGPDLLYLFWPTIFAYLRITTNPRALLSPLASTQAIENIDGLLRLPHVVTAAEGEAFWRTYVASGGRTARGNAVRLPALQPYHRSQGSSGTGLQAGRAHLIRHAIPTLHPETPPYAQASMR